MSEKQKENIRRYLESRGIPERWGITGDQMMGVIEDFGREIRELETEQPQSESPARRKGAVFH